MKRKGIVLVTGASCGIGEAVARSFAGDGYAVVMNAQNKEALCAAAERIRAESGAPVLAVSGDVSDCAAVSALFEETDRFAAQLGLCGRLDVLVNNAGVAYIGLLQEMRTEDWRRVMGVNLDAVFYTCREAVPRMLRAHAGKILNISSAWGVVGASCEAAYSAAKGGVNALSAALAKELAPSGISVNAIACGVIDTRMNGQLSPEEREALTEEIPAGRMAAPEEVGELCLRLCSVSSYLTGQTIRFDGGWI